VWAATPCVFACSLCLNGLHRDYALCSFFNDTVSLCSVEYLNLRHYPEICLEILRKTTKGLCEARGCPGRLSNLALPKHKEEASVPVKVHGVMCQRPVNFIVAAGMTSGF
jgi:hypothetical protein